MNRIVNNAKASWVTTVSGAVLGLPQAWEAIRPMFDNVADTLPDWGGFFQGMIIFVALLVARDGPVTSEQARGEP